MRQSSAHTNIFV